MIRTTKYLKIEEPWPSHVADVLLPLSCKNCTATLQHLIAAALASGRGVTPAELVAEMATDDDLRNGAVALDSLDQLIAARHVAEFFELEKAGIEELLLRRTRLSQWSEAIVESLSEGVLTQLWFRSSGTSGDPKLVPQSFSRLTSEVHEIGRFLTNIRRVVSLVPLHHIYGFIWGSLLSDQLKVPLVHGEWAAKVAFGGLQPGDLIVGVPEWWRYFAGSSRRFPAEVQGVTSTAPCPPDVIKAVTGKGLASMVEVYGSSETAGIGWRRNPAEGFKLFGHWTKFDDDRLVSVDKVRFTLPDIVSWQTDRSLVPRKRRDNAIQVGGVNVWPNRIGAFIETHSLVQACAVRPFETGDGLRLKAFVVPKREAPGGAHGVMNDQQVKRQLRDWIRLNLPAPERPIQLTLGDELPRNTMGKLCDW